MIPRVIFLAASAAMVLGACQRAEEGELRAQVEGWLSVGETVSFASTRACAAAAYRLVDTQLKSAVRVVGDVPSAARMLAEGRVVAIDAPGLTPDAALLALIDADLGLGMRLRISGLEARACMDAGVEDAFFRALSKPGAVVILDPRERIVALVDREARLLIVAIGTDT
ncbi:hypothetical protein KUD11_09995 [Roseovarius sp. LXJ103]|uniref:hypothetical protein n=1 Tax=Roseovarius carneus TaxID=2853164 RepID=UPI000D608E14|nr:hypothetical protein [Roseovarius carneus]MBZ8118978.1 hypothetical protein [Roseovarius carneus]PWE35369.1 hypothetical protein DD563_04960 [Pelagicola sp. LXJ1103]